MPLRLTGFRPVLHAEAPHSCKHCARITITEQHIRESEQPGALIRLPHTICEAKLAAQDGCALFKFYHYYFMRFTLCVMAREMLRSLAICFTPWKKVESELRIANRGLQFPEPLDQSWSTDQSIWKISTRWKHFKYIVSHLSSRHLYIVLIRRTLRMHYLAHTEQHHAIGFPSPTFLYHVTTPSDDPAAYLVPKRSINPIVWGEQSLTFAKQWLTECHASHVECRPPTPKKGPFVPEKLLKLTCDNENVHVQLYETSQGESIQWCALSYCWGGDQPMKATQKTLEELKRGIPVTKLPQTLQDAVTVSRTLEIQFLWVDALCIMQDSEHDMVRELQLVPFIYRYAFVTISASSAKTVQEGFLHDRGYFYGTSEPFTLPYRSSDGLVGKLLMSEDKMYTDNRTDWQEPINHRCWTLQEQMLSPRMLVFEQRQLKFRCTVCSGDGTNGVSKDDKQGKARSLATDTSATISPKSGHSKSSKIGFRDQRSDDPVSHEAVVQEPAASEPNSHQPTLNRSASKTHAHKSSSSTSPASMAPAIVNRGRVIQHRRQESWSLWREIVEQYSRRSLSFPQDKLRAMSGLARVVSQKWRIEYVAGLFAQHLPLALCWTRQEFVAMPRLFDTSSAPIPLPHVGPAPLPSYEGAPSWSWLAAEGEVAYGGQFWDFNRFKSQVEIQKISISPRPPFTPYDAMNGGTITLKGRLASARWYISDHKLMVREHEFSAYNNTGRKDLPQGDGVYIDAWALLLVTERVRPHGAIQGEEDGKEFQSGVFYSMSPDGYLAGLVLEACGEGTFKRLDVFSEPSFKRAYFFEDVEPQIVRLI